MSSFLQELHAPMDLEMGLGYGYLSPRNLGPAAVCWESQGHLDGYATFSTN